MAQTTPPTVDTLPASPSTSSPSTFAALADAFIAALAVFRTQLIALATNCYNNALDAFTSASNAAASAVTATTQATAAVSGVNAIAWVSGTTYAVGNVRYSPVDFRSYRRITAGAGTTDPSLDTTNWLLLSQRGSSVLHVREERASGTNGSAGTAATLGYRRVLNTVKTNTITGASLASNQIVLPAGTYNVSIRAPLQPVDGTVGDTFVIMRLFLRNITDSTYALLGDSCAISDLGAMNYSQVNSELVGQFTITATKTFEIWHYVTASSIATWGWNSGSGQLEVYTEAFFDKVG